MPHPLDNPNYKPSPQPITTYSGPAIPSAYDPNWQYFNNLTSDQIAWFKAQPEWQNFVAYVQLNPTAATINAGVSAATINAALAAAGQIPLPPIVVTPPTQ